MGGGRDGRKDVRKGRGKGREGEVKGGGRGACSKVLVGDRRPWLRVNVTAGNGVRMHK